jgi:hypothetical protein
VCVYYCRTLYKAVRVGDGRWWRTCTTRDDDLRPDLTRPDLTPAHSLVRLHSRISTRFSNLYTANPIVPTTCWVGI